MDPIATLSRTPPQDWFWFAAAFLGVALVIGLAEGLRAILKVSTEFTRKFVHVAVGLFAPLAPFLFQTRVPVVLIAAIFSLVSLIAIRKGLLKGMHGDRHSYGTFYYCLSILILALLTFPENAILFVVGISVMAVADAVAAIVGESLTAPHKYRLSGDHKSLEGSLTMLVVSTAVIFVLLRYYPVGAMPLLSNTTTAMGYALIIALPVTAAEALSSRGSDNLTVPLFTALFLFHLVTHTSAGNFQLATGVLLGLLAASAAFYLRFLSLSGAVATYLLASVIFGFGGWQWTLPILAFFVLSSLLSKAGRTVKQRYDLIFEKGDRRDWAQVLANGGTPGLLMVLYMLTGAPILYPLYLAALAAATADSWGTEIGTFFRHSPRLITTFHSVEPGTSGGVTLAGTLGGAVGAAIIALCGGFFLHVTEDYFWLWVGAIALSGVIGSLIDSLLGATLQAQYRCSVCGKITERLVHCDNLPTERIRGRRWMNNDAVNLISNTAAPLLLGALLVMLK